MIHIFKCISGGFFSCLDFWVGFFGANPGYSLYLMHARDTFNTQYYNNSCYRDNVTENQKHQYQTWLKHQINHTSSLPKPLNVNEDQQ